MTIAFIITFILALVVLVAMSVVREYEHAPRVRIVLVYVLIALLIVGAVLTLMLLGRNS